MTEYQMDSEKTYNLFFLGDVGHVNHMCNT